MSTHTWRLLVASAIGLGAIFACIMVFVIFELSKDRPLPFEYTDVTPAGKYARALCPGEPLVFDLQVTVSDAPSIVLVAENWQASGGRTIADLSPAWYIQEIRKEARAQQSIPIPNLSPGGWVYERAGSVNTVDHPALLLIPFEIRADCQ